ncbi:MAG TPA: hypothetical protein VF062_14795 [Candidatus Limnocylindrales bacterium]
MLATFAITVALGAAAWSQPVSPMPEPPPRCDISSTVPQYGGAYVSAGVLHIWLTEPEVDERAVAAALAQQCPGLVPPGTPEIEIHDADYTVSQLRAWARAATSLMNRPDISMTGVNEQTNRVMVGTSRPDGDRAELVAALNSEGVPEAAVEFLEMTGATMDMPVDDGKWRWIGGAAVLLTLAVGFTVWVSWRRRRRVT